MIGVHFTLPDNRWRGPQNVLSTFTFETIQVTYPSVNNINIAPVFRNIVEIRIGTMLEKTLKEMAYELAPIGIVVTENRIIRSCNNCFADMFGYLPDELKDSSFEALYPSNEEFMKIKNIGVEALRDTNQYTDVRIMARRDGTLFWCRVRGYTMTREDPLQNAVWSFADLSDTRPYQGLTTRERQIVMHIGEGRTSKEIARILEISPRTVEVYRAKLLKKFGVKNMAELLQRAGGFPA